MTRRLPQAKGMRMRNATVGKVAVVVASGVILGLTGLVSTVQGQSGGAESPFLAEFLQRFFDPIRQGDPIDLTGLDQTDTVLEATSYAASDGSFGVTIAEVGGGLDIMSIASVDENLAPVPQDDQTSVRMSKADLDAFVAAVRQWQVTTDGVEPVERCPDWPLPGDSENVLLQEVVALRAADGRPAYLQITASNLISAEASGRLKPIWFVVMTLQTGKEWRCPE